MKRISWSMAAILLGTALAIAGCKGKEGPAGVSGTGPTTTVLCSSPSAQGYSVVATPESLVNNYLLASPVTLVTSGTAISLTHYVASAAVSGQIRMGIYTDNANQPANLVAETAPQFMTPTSWNTFKLLSDTYLPAGTYWVAFITPHATGCTYAVSANHRYYYLGWSALPATFPAASSGLCRFSQTINICP